MKWGALGGLVSRISATLRPACAGVPSAFWTPPAVMRLGLGIFVQGKLSPERSRSN
jgi:hypothetical protein